MNPGQQHSVSQPLGCATRIRWCKKIPEVLRQGELNLEGAGKRLVWGMGSGKELEKGGQGGGRETMKRDAKESAFGGAPRVMARSLLDFAGILAPTEASASWLGGKQAAVGRGDPGTNLPAACSRNDNEAKNKCSTSK